MARKVPHTVCAIPRARAQSLRPLRAAQQVDEERQAQVMDLWLRGVSQEVIARALGVTQHTIQDDLETIRRELRDEREGDLGEKVAYTIALRKRIQTEAWAHLSRLPDTSVNASGLASVILTAQDAIDRLEGVSAPEWVHAAAVTELLDTAMAAAGEMGGLDLQRRFVSCLRDHALTRARLYSPMSS